MSSLTAERILPRRENEEIIKGIMLVKLERKRKRKTKNETDGRRAGWLEKFF
jgi:hypothetical protein